MADWIGHLEAAEGYLELGMIESAAAEIEGIEAGDKTRLEVLEFRVELFRASKQWDGLEAVARHLYRLQPEEPRWILDIACAVRRFRGLPEARQILKQTEPKFPDCALLQYNLACYACVEGDIAEAKERLKRAIELKSSLRLLALEDPDLEEIFGAEKRPGMTP